jgi:hypothetical protein
MKGLGFFVGGLLLQVLGFRSALWLMAGLIGAILVLGLLSLPRELGKAKASKSVKELFAKSRAINLLAAARIFLFGARDVWFVVGLPVFLYANGWSFLQVGGFLAAWTIAYGVVQAAAPRVIAGTASAKFDALKNQLDPHFLFNSLNVLTSLIDENPESAQKFTTSLSKVYRYVLEQKNKDLVTVDEELDFARTYMSLLKMRFEDSIVFDIPDRASNPDSKVVPLSLQLLLENAVKHNMVTTSKPLHIKIYEDTNGNLVVENNLQPKQIVKKGSGVGLENIKQRYQLLTHKKVNINQQAGRFAVAIPMLSKQISFMETSTQSQSKFDDSYIRARSHVEELKKFYGSLISYFFFIPFFILINYWTSWDFKWFWFPIIGWGIGLVIHALKVFVNDGSLGRNWEKRKIEQFMKEEEDRKRWN